MNYYRAREHSLAFVPTVDHLLGILTNSNLSDEDRTLRYRYYGKSWPLNPFRIHVPESVKRLEFGSEDEVHHILISYNFDEQVFNITCCYIHMGNRRFDPERFTIVDPETIKKILKWYYDHDFLPTGYDCNDDSKCHAMYDPAACVPSAQTMMQVIEMLAYLRPDDLGVSYYCNQAMLDFLNSKIKLHWANLECGPIRIGRVPGSGCYLRTENGQKIKLKYNFDAKDIFEWCYQHEIKPDLDY